jgi:UDP-2,4-diacetamido-2,4,6-trideoxy-beta-L-altropyranose hydrolase
MNVLIRVDSSEKTGSGHVVRCLTLAETLRGRGADVRFLSCELPGNVLELVRRSGFAVLALACSAGGIDDEAGSVWFYGKSWQTDAAECAALAEGVDRGVDWLIVDHYGIDIRWEMLLRPHVQQIAVIDDLADRTHDCDLLIDANLQVGGPGRYDGLVPPHCVRLQHPKYSLLRPEFAQGRAALRHRDGRVRRVLVFFGGMDPSNQTCKALQAIASLQRDDIATDVVVGATNPHKETVREFCATHLGIQYHCQTDRMAELMAAADLAIGAGGTTTWERCAMGLPSIVVTLADNQIPSTRMMAEEGRLLYLGDQGDVSAAAIAHVIAGLLEAPGWLELLAKRSAELVDGRGTERVARFFSASTLSLRRAQLEDCRAVYAWRNDEQTRRFSHDSSYIPYADHERWYIRALANPNRILLIGEAEGRSVGVLCCDLEQSKATVSIYLAPEWRGHGLGARLLRAGSEWMRRNHPAIRELMAEILSGNKASHVVFADAGYIPYCSIYKQDC